MKRIRMIVFSVIASFISIQQTSGKSFVHHKSEDNYLRRENDISEDAPLLPIQGGLEASRQSTNEQLEQLYGSGNPYGMDGYDSEDTYNLERFYDVDNLFNTNNFMGATEGEDFFNPEEDSGTSAIEDLPKSTIISETYGHPQQNEPVDDDLRVPDEVENDDDSKTAEDSNEDTGMVESDESEPEKEWSSPLPYWTPPSEIDENPYLMGIPAQLQSFPMFNPNYYPRGYKEEEEAAAIEREQEREAREEELRNNNALHEEHLKHLQARRFRRGLSRVLHLRNKISDPEQVHGKEKGVRGDFSQENVVLNNQADCGGGGRGTNRRGGNNGGQGGNSGDGGVDNAVDTAQGAANNAVGTVQGAANDAVDAAENVADNLRLAGNGRRGRRQRNGNNGKRR